MVARASRSRRRFCHRISRPASHCQTRRPRPSRSQRLPVMDRLRRGSVGAAFSIVTITFLRMRKLSPLPPRPCLRCFFPTEALFTLFSLHLGRAACWETVWSDGYCLVVGG